jgi:hypothetical protein
MSKYRIVKEEDYDPNGKLKNTWYFIQKKVLFFWINASIRSCYSLGKFHSGSSDKMLSRIAIYHLSREEAEYFLDKYLQNPFKEVYKGNTIIMAYDEHTPHTHFFINKSNLTEHYSGVACYEYSSSLDELKKRIDSRIVYKRKSILT